MEISLQFLSSGFNQAPTRTRLVLFYQEDFELGAAGSDANGIHRRTVEIPNG